MPEELVEAVVDIAAVASEVLADQEDEDVLVVGKADEGAEAVVEMKRADVVDGVS